jgi:hypothetical protein
MAPSWSGRSLDLPEFTFAGADGKPKSGRFPRQNRASQHLGDPVRPLPRGDAGFDALETKPGSKEFAVAAVNIDRGRA